MTRNKVLAVTAAVALGLLWAWSAIVTASIGELEGAPVQLPIVQAIEGWETLIQVQNVSSLPTRAIMFLWGDYSGACPPNDPGPIASLCSGSILPGSAWTVVGGIPAEARSAIVYPVSLAQADAKCAEAQNAVSDSSAWLAWVENWEAEARGGVLAVTGHRVGPDDDGTTVSSAYTGISEELDEPGSPFDYFAPMNKRAYDGFDTELDIQNSGQICTSVWVRYQGQESCRGERDQHIEQLAPGETRRRDVPDDLGDGWRGSASIRANAPLGIVVDEWGQDMLFTHQAPLLAEVNGSLVSYAPLIYLDQEWSAVVQVQNLSQTGQPTFVTVSFLDDNGDPVGSPLSDWICTNGSESFYIPSFDALPGQFIGAAVIESQSHILPPSQDEIPAAPVYAVVRLLNSSTGQGMSYNAITQGQAEGIEAISLPRLAKNDQGWSSEIAIRNNSAQNRLEVALDIYNESGLLTTVFRIIEPGHVSYVRLDDLASVPDAFVGSGVMWVTDVEGDGPLMLAAVVVERASGSDSGDLTKGYAGILLTDDYPRGDGYEPTPTPTATTTPTPTSTPTPTPVSIWTVMIYLNGDNNLDGWTAALFNRLELAVASEPSLIVRALWDRSGDGDTVLYQVQPDTRTYALADYVEGQTRWSWGELDMGDPATLQSFIVDTTQELTTEHYLLAMVNHGGGWSPELPISQRASHRYAAGGSGFSWDVTDDYNYLSTQDMGGIFSQISDPIDVVFYDACLMGMIEEAYEIRNGARFLVASQNETWTTFPYYDYLVGIQDRTPEDQAAWMVDEYYASLLGYPRTMTVLDLQRAGAMSMALDNLAIQLSTVIPTQTLQINEVFLATQKLDYDYDLAISDTEGYVDLGDFAARLSDEFSGTGVASAADALLDALSGYSNPMVLYERHGSGVAGWEGPDVDLEGVTGLSVYLPFGEDDPDLPFYLNSQLELANDTCWDEFIFDFLNLPYPQTPPDSPGGRGANPQPLSPPKRVFLPIIIKGQ